MIAGSELYEVSLTVETDEACYCVEHCFARLPEIETLVALKGEASRTFRALYETEPERMDIYVRRMTPDERTPSSDREHAPRS